MFKSLNDIERKMRKILIDFKSDGQYPDVSDKENAYAFYLCCKQEYIANVFIAQNANRDYLFQKSGNDHITKEGLKFIRDMSLGFRIKNAIFDVLKGTWGFLLGILSTVIAEIIIL